LQTQVSYCGLCNPALPHGGVLQAVWLCKHSQGDFTACVKIARVVELSKVTNQGEWVSEELQISTRSECIVSVCELCTDHHGHLSTCCIIEDVIQLAGRVVGAARQVVDHLKRTVRARQ